MQGLVVTLNAGSSSLKGAVFHVDRTGVWALHRQTFGAGGAALAVDQMLDWAVRIHPKARLLGVGHRVVHGGPDHADPALVDDELMSALEGLSSMAPLHQPQCLAGIQAVAAARPGVRQVACFDTAFHRTQPDVATRFGLPRPLHDQGYRRYGFHGLSYQHVAEQLARLAPQAAKDRIIAAHLGAGASLCAMLDGRSVDTTMGFSPLDGLVMATRCGALDPGVVLHLRDHGGYTARKLEGLLYRQSGLLGVSGLSGDMRELLASASPEAAQAVELFVYRIAREAGALASSLGGLDGVVFTGGVGENSVEIRRRVAERLRWLGLELDWQANQMDGEGRINAPGSGVGAWIIQADEEGVIARHALSKLRRARAFA